MSLISQSADISLQAHSLVGHSGSVNSIAFSKCGKYLCSGSSDNQLWLWSCEDFSNYNTLTGHKGAVLEVKWLGDSNIVSCSADGSVVVWDGNSGRRVRKLMGHSAIVNTCAAVAHNTVISGSDDCSAVLWDVRTRNPLFSWCHDHQICSVALTSDGDKVFTSGVDGIIRSFDIRTGRLDLSLMGHADCVTGLAVSPDNSVLISNSMDSSLRSWNIKGHSVYSDRMKRSYGVLHGAEKLLLRCSWSSCQSLVAAGSSDRLVHVWDSELNEKFCCGGHKAAVTEVIFHPNTNIMASCGTDRQIVVSKYSN